MKNKEKFLNGLPLDDVYQSRGKPFKKFSDVFEQPRKISNLTEKKLRVFTTRHAKLRCVK